MALFRSMLSRFLLVLVSVPALSLALFGASVALAICQLGHVPGQRDPDVDTLGHGWLTHSAVWLLFYSVYLVPLLAAVLGAEWLNKKLTWAKGIGRLLFFFLPWLCFFGLEMTHAEVLDWFFD
jgi:hypothetical protein